MYTHYRRVCVFLYTCALFALASGLVLLAWLMSLDGPRRCWLLLLVCAPLFLSTPSLTWAASAKTRQACMTIGQLAHRLAIARDLAISPEHVWITMTPELRQQEPRFRGHVRDLMLTIYGTPQIPPARWQTMYTAACLHKQSLSRELAQAPGRW